MNADTSHKQYVTSHESIASCCRKSCCRMWYHSGSKLDSCWRFGIVELFLVFTCKDSHKELFMIFLYRSLNYLSVNWYRRTDSGRTLIQNDAVKYLLSMYRRRLTIKAPVTADSGVYECEASFQRPGGPTYPPAISTANLTVQGNFW